MQGWETGGSSEGGGACLPPEEDMLDRAGRNSA